MHLVVVYVKENGRNTFAGRALTDDSPFDKGHEILRGYFKKTGGERNTEYHFEIYWSGASRIAVYEFENIVYEPNEEIEEDDGPDYIY